MDYGSIRERYRSEVLSPGSRIASLLDVRVAQRMFDEHSQGAFDHSYTLWAMWMLERWSVSQKRRDLPATASQIA